MRHKEMPPLFSSMVAIGERTGKLDYMLEHIAKFYKSESDTAIGSITQLIEPILVLVLGFAVAILVSSILLPIYSLVGAS
jgi:type IV pilus assembly protein PilC